MLRLFEETQLLKKTESLSSIKLKSYFPLLDRLTELKKLPDTSELRQHTYFQKQSI